MARTSKFPDIEEGTKQELYALARGHSVEKRASLRARIVLDWMEGFSFKESAARNGVSEMTISKWRGRFRDRGLEGLRDAPRSGQPKRIDEGVRKKVVHFACTKPEEKRRYSQKEIAEMTGVSQSRVSDILREEELKPHKTEYWCGKSPDPEFEKKMLEIVGLYLNPPSNALVLSVDEKTQIQALDRTQPELPMKKGKPRRLTNTYKRNGTVNLIAALSVHEGEVTAREIERNDADHFLRFLKLLDRKYRNVELHLVLDNLAVHKNKKVMEWLERKRKFHVHYTPTYSSWLNQIEIWFSILTRDVLKDGVWGSREQLVKELRRYIEYYNKEKAKPFQWTHGEDLQNTKSN